MGISQSLLKNRNLIICFLCGVFTGLPLALAVLIPLTAEVAPTDSRPQRPRGPRPSPRGPGALSQPPLTVAVLTVHPGMPAAAVEKTITNPIERRLRQTPGVDRMESRSINGASVILVQYQGYAGRSQTITLATLRALGGLSTLPPDTRPPMVLPFDPAVTTPLGVVTVGHPELNEAQLRALAIRDVQIRLGAVPGGSVPMVLGGTDLAVVLTLDPSRLAAHNLSPLDVVKALRQEDLPVAPGVAAGGADRLLPDFNVRAQTVEELHNLPLRPGPNNAVFLRDVGRFQEGQAVPTSRMRVNGRRAVCVPIYRQWWAGAEAVHGAIESTLTRIGADLPRGTELRWLPFGTSADPQADAALLTLSLRAPSSLRLDASEQRIAEVERFLEERIPAPERRLIVSELGLAPDLSTIYTRNAAEQDTTIRLQLSEAHHQHSQQYARKMRRWFRDEPRFQDLQVRIETSSTRLRLGPAAGINIQVQGESLEEDHRLAQKVRQLAANVLGAVDVQLCQRLDAPGLEIEVDRTKATALGLSPADITFQALAALSARRPFGRVSRTGPPYEVWMQYAGNPGANLDDVLNASVLGTGGMAVKLGHVIQLRRTTAPVEIHHLNGSRLINVWVNTEGRDRQAVVADIRDQLRSLDIPKDMRIEIPGE
jgi:multidrug efflux pump subunit AcrB